MKSLFEPPSHVTLRRYAYQEIRRGIELGDLRQGQRLVEGEIAAQMEISRGPVREAIRQLEKDGLVISVPRKGSFVAELSEKAIWEIYSLRTILEGFAARLAAERACPDDIATLEGVVRQIEDAARAQDRSELSKLDLKFHSHVVSMAQHSRLTNAWLQMNAQLALVLTTKDEQYYDLEKVALNHRRLVEAIRSGNAEEAEMRMRHHIDCMASRVLDSTKETA